ncbi:menaquinone-dependent protoporphyrinogen IX dehydrogenase [Marinomonas epiphytica]
MSKTLILYSTTDGQTIKICQAMSSQLEALGHTVQTSAIAEANADSLTGQDTVIIGASIRYGKHQAHVAEFINQHKATLSSLNSAFFTVNLVARKALKNQPGTNPYMIKFLDQVDWHPNHKGVFAGRLNYPKYSFLDRQMIRFIMWMTKGPTDTNTDTEFTDWQSVKQFTKQIHESQCQVNEKPIG